ncbi:hypothetical protein NW801_06490 [Brevibacillus laterosporus]|uniref:Uncharacterized protein n=1 Tax=Brevibacillus halotolerans TaxID=1507437 RepID=A0ABT4HUK8_9BACL|nr:hypothetical protein [Brevibacillus halotolerans]MCR8984729.1 hypothetical protein [Brevibacillus laterosporus]MCZ0830454.1 hypothetical protein [Brevibacillus halotolerans]
MHKQKDRIAKGIQDKTQSHTDRQQKGLCDQAETADLVLQTKQTENEDLALANSLPRARVPKVNAFKLQQLEAEIARKEEQCKEWQREMEQAKDNYVQLVHYQDQLEAQEQEIKQLYETWYAMQGEE